MSNVGKIGNIFILGQSMVSVVQQEMQATVISIQQ